jgi:hypothetical protein
VVTSSWWIVLILAALVVPLVIGLRRIDELFVLRIDQGNVRLVRGRIPPRLLGDLRDVLAAAPIEHGELKAVVESGRPVLRARPTLPPPIAQRLRNTISLWPLAKIRNAPRR